MTLTTVLRRARGFAVAIGAAGALVAPSAHAQGYAASPIGWPGARFSFASGINDAGQIAGTYVVGDRYDGPTRGYLLAGGTFTEVRVPGSSDTRVTGISAAGHLVGWANGAAGTSAFVALGGTFTPFAGPGGAAALPFGVNSAGHVVGHSLLAGSGVASFLYADGALTPIAVPGAGPTVALGINDAGQVVGYYQGPGGARERGFVYSAGTYTTLEMPGAELTLPSGINALGQVVGSYTLVGVAGLRSFLYSDGEYTTLDIPGGATGINAAGQIVGSYQEPGVVGSRGFLATPTTVPEPATVVLVAAGLGAAGAWRRRGRRAAGRPGRPPIVR